MKAKQAETVVDGKLAALNHVDPGALSSDGKSWSGFPLKEYLFRAGGPPFRFELEDPALAFVIKGDPDEAAEWRSGGTNYSYRWNAGRICFINSAYELSSVAMPTCRQIILRIDRWTAAQLMGYEGNVAPKLIQDLFVNNDAQIGHIMRGMRNEIAANCPSGRLYGKSLSLALLSFLLARYPRRKLERRSGALPGSHRFRAVLNFIEANLHKDLSLSSLAELTGMTPQHFCCTFKATFHASPHQYIIRERMRVARGLLADRRLSIAEIAFAVGFSSQSHFTAIFHRSMGVTPVEYQRTL